MYANSGSRTTTKARSYTLIELIMVLAVLALAAAVLVPNMVGGDSLRVQAAVRLIISDLSYAQSDALANQQFRRVVFYDNGDGYCILNVPNEAFVTPADLESPAALNLYIYDPLGSRGQYIVNFAKDNRFEGVTLSAITLDGVVLADRPEITYDELGGTIVPGGIPGIGGTIVVSMADVSYQINIAPFTGKMTVMEL